MNSLQVLKISDLKTILTFITETDYSNWTAATLRECLLRLDYCGWLLKVENKAVAYILLNIAGDEAHIMHLAVHPQQRNKGYAYVLLQSILPKLTVLGKIKIILEVSTNNSFAIKLYEKCGFIAINRRKAYYYINGKYHDACIYLNNLELKLAL